MSRNFELALEKGAVGERVCRLRLERQGWVVYQPITEGSHAFDMLAIQNKARAVAIDVKAKARLNKWRATGINQKHFETYQAFSQAHLMPFWLFFVDEHERKIYGNCLEALEQPVDIDGRTWPAVMTFAGVPTRVWHLDQMITISDLDEMTATELSTLSQRSYEFAPTELAQ